jgi:hypothetical protein
MPKKSLEDTAFIPSGISQVAGGARQIKGRPLKTRIVTKKLIKSQTNSDGFALTALYGTTQNIIKCHAVP